MYGIYEKYILLRHVRLRGFLARTNNPMFFAFSL